MPPKKMIITQNLLFNVPFALVMNIVSVLTNPNVKFDFTFIPSFLVALVLIEVLGFVIPVQKIAGAVGGKIAPNKNPMAFPQFLVVAAVLTVIFTVLMTAGMTCFGLLMAGNLGAFFPAYLGALIPMLPTAYACVLVFLPLSMGLSGLGKWTAEHQNDGK